MSLSANRIIFGIHSMCPYSRTTGQPYGIMKVIGSASLALTAELEQLFAGSNKFAWAAEAKTVNAELSIKLKEYPNFLFELFLGAQVTANGAEANGSVSGSANVKGTSIINGTNGITVGLDSGSGANLKYGKYILVATGPAAADVYLLSDVDMLRGADVSYINDNLKIGSIDVSSATQDDGATTGLSYVKNGTPAFVTGDTAEFYVRPPNSSSADIVVGAASTVFPAFGAKIVAQKRATGEIFDMEIFNMVANGMPVALEENAFSQPEIKVACLYDSSKDAVARMKAYTPA
jgi:hypothetical protein